MNSEQTQPPNPQDSELMNFLGEIADKLEEVNSKLDTLLGIEEKEEVI